MAIPYCDLIRSRIPVLHFSLCLTGLLDPRLDSERDTLTLLFILGMGFVALIREGLLSSENRRLDRERTAANEQLQFARRLEGIGRLAAGIAHEFNNNLTVILTSSELLQTQLAPHDTRRIHPGAPGTAGLHGGRSE